jgi:hypothetical protein
MKNYWIAFILIVSLGFFGLGTIIFKNFIQKPKPQQFYLDLDSMQMAVGQVTNSPGQRPQVVAIFSCDMKNTSSEVIPWADLYVCRSYNKSDSLSGDTAIVFIDTHTKSDLHDIKNIDHYGVGIKMAQGFKKCRIMVPANQIDNIRKCRYRFAQVTLVDDWLSD